MTIKQWQEKINEWAKGKGWNEDLNVSPDSVGKQIANMHSELSEAWEEIKNGHTVDGVYTNDFHIGLTGGGKPEGFPIELADCVIRILHSCEFYGIDLEKMMEIKQAYNETRSYRHGGKKA